MNVNFCLNFLKFQFLLRSFYLKIFYPGMQKLDDLIEKKGVRIFTIFFMLFMTFDIVISCMAADRQQKRHQQLPPANAIEVFLDEHYPDELMDRVYNNKKEVEFLPS